MQTWTATLLKKTTLLLGEGACWHPEWNRFLFVDIESRKVGCIDPVTAESTERLLPKKVGAVVPYKNNQLLVALQGSLELLDFITGEWQHLCQIESDKPDNRCNDGKCDARGRFWVGTMHVAAEKGKGALYCYDGTLRKVLPSVSISNGLCWNSDNTVMYYIDSADRCIRSYAYDLEKGTISDKKIAVQINEPTCVPDGMCMDEEGMLWVALWDGGCVQRFNPATGELIGRVEVPAPRVTTCAFGGTNRDLLLIVTASIGLTEAQRDQFPFSGSLFLVDPGVKGLTTYHFQQPVAGRL